MSFKKLMLATLLAAIMLIFTVSLVVAAPAGFDRAGTSRSGVAWSQVITPTTTLSKTHPVGLAISLYFDIPYTQVMTLRDSGFGFGVIARAYLTAKVLSGTLTAEELLAQHQAGTGWGEIKKEYGVSPGGNGLGAIMGKGGKPDFSATPASPDGSSVNAPGGKPNCPGNSCNAPGQQNGPKVKPTKPPKK
jgi:hypothetical protein